MNQPAYSVDEGTSYPILPLQNIELRSGRTLQTEPPAATKQKENKNDEHKIPIQIKHDDEIQNKQMQTMHPLLFLRD